MDIPCRMLSIKSILEWENSVNGFTNLTMRLLDSTRPWSIQRNHRSAECDQPRKAELHLLTHLSINKVECSRMKPGTLKKLPASKYHSKLLKSPNMIIRYLYIKIAYTVNFMIEIWNLSHCWAGYLIRIQIENFSLERNVHEGEERGANRGRARGRYKQHNWAGQKLGWEREDGGGDEVCQSRRCETAKRGSRAPWLAGPHSQVSRKQPSRAWWRLSFPMLDSSFPCRSPRPVHSGGASDSQLWNQLTSKQCTISVLHSFAHYISCYQACRFFYGIYEGIFWIPCALVTSPTESWCKLH